MAGYYNVRKYGDCFVCNTSVEAVTGKKCRLPDTNGVVFTNTGRREVFIHFRCAPEFIRELPL